MVQQVVKKKSFEYMKPSCISINSIILRENKAYPTVMSFGADMFLMLFFFSVETIVSNAVVINWSI